VQRNPTQLGVGSTQPTKCKVAQVKKPTPTFEMKFHISGAAGLKNGQFNRKRNYAILA
jgi:hypothetical protein